MMTASGHFHVQIKWAWGDSPPLSRYSPSLRESRHQIKRLWKDLQRAALNLVGTEFTREVSQAFIAALVKRLRRWKDKAVSPEATDPARWEEFFPYLPLETADLHDQTAIAM
ncbi:UNVERIFIED_CONTAM: hypothetical protein K2H54_025212 [Gekko kuhli]